MSADTMTDHAADVAPEYPAPGHDAPAAAVAKPARGKPGRKPRRQAPVAVSTRQTDSPPADLSTMTVEQRLAAKVQIDERQAILDPERGWRRG